MRTPSASLSIKLLASLALVAWSGAASARVAPVGPAYPNDCPIYSYSQTPGGIADAHRGDLVFNRVANAATADTIGQLMSTIGQPVSHVGVVTDYGQHVRHNYPNFSDLGAEDHADDWLLWNVCLGSSGVDIMKLPPRSLQNGQNGTRTTEMSSEMAPGGADFVWRNAGNASFIARAKAGQAAAASAVADAMDGLNYTYNLYAYSNMDAAYTQGGSHCSGTVFKALQNSGNTGGFFERIYWENDRVSIAQQFGPAIFSMIQPRVRAKMSSNCSYPLTKIDRMTGNMTNQMMNSLLFGQFESFSDCWKTGACSLNYGMTEGPTDMFNQINTNSTMYQAPVPTTVAPIVYTSTIVGNDSSCHVPGSGPGSPVL